MNLQTCILANGYPDKPFRIMHCQPIRALVYDGKYSIWGYLLVFVLLLLDFKYYDYVQQ